MTRVRDFWAKVMGAWHKARVAEVALGKYIILCVSIMHVSWAILLFSSPAAAKSTPLHVLAELCGGRYRAAIVLILAAAPAMFYPFVRFVGKYSLAFMLIPQQSLLLMSAGAGISAAAVHHYADGVGRSFTFIAGDQLPITCIALLYTIAVVEAAWSDRRVV